MPKKVDWGAAAERTGLTKENGGKPGATDRVLELRRLRVVELAIDEIAPNPQQPRRLFDDASGEGNTLEKLAADIRQNGVLQAILVVERAPGQYQIVAGERRWRAASLAGLGQIPARILTQREWPRPLDDREIMALAMAENYQRKDLEPQEAAANARQLAELGYTQVEIGRILGRSQGYISRLLAGAEAAENMRDAYSASPAILAEAQQIEDPAARENMTRQVATGKAGLRQVRAARKAEKAAADPVRTLRDAAGVFVLAVAPVNARPAEYAAHYDDVRAILTETESIIGQALEALRQAHKTAKGEASGQTKEKET